MRFIFRRLAFYVVTLWVSLTLNFIIPRLMPGNPVQEFFARTRQIATPQAVAAMEAAFGVGAHQSFASQYLHYLSSVLHGDLGRSITFFPSTVTQVIWSALPWTLGLVGIATVISFVIGTMLGVLSAWKRGTWVDHLLPITAFFSAVPYFWLGAVAIMIFSRLLGWLPQSGAYSTDITPALSLSFIGSVVTYGILPAGTIIVSSMAGWVLGMRNVMLTTIPEDYVLLGRAKGLSSPRVVFAYAARNAVVPVLANFALSMGFIVGGAILTEIVFSYPGVGDLLYQAVSNQDYPLMQGLFLIITVLVLIANLAADVAYVVLDPRTRERDS